MDSYWCVEDHPIGLGSFGVTKTPYTSVLLQKGFKQVLATKQIWLLQKIKSFQGYLTLVECDLTKLVLDQLDLPTVHTNWFSAEGCTEVQPKAKDFTLPN